jgi:anti-sigma regulatory factor (Ser/Thr protein kinase)
MATMDDAIIPSYWAQVRWVLDAGPLNVPVVCNAAWATMHSWGLGVLADDVAFIVGELAANAWMRQPPVAVLLRLEDSAILVQVSDAGPDMDMFSTPDLLGIQGRGLPAVASLAQEIGLHADHTGKAVWARLRFQWVSPPEDSAAAA